ncbi:MAG: single-stranded-DNA-specific exonuclease RecJ [Alphaproteobacteria bacterium]|nr:single-stranded-DNA-specific exonuclease RecJ [Alphaproteobacteria bacterium]NCQ88134.1 single-stranded-DNA-specific exonuclease RecJ [Alphaproteobacteria bacterium]NCT05359.1 single-stranded-DNA-specific exonuclease RecJ [Alphaproteobacteria bacterium]
MNKGETNALNVTKSLGGKSWRFFNADEAEITRIIQTKQLPEFIARLLCQRGIASDSIDAFFNPTLRDNFPDPFSMAGMEALSDDLSNHIMAAEKGAKTIGILADFDVDGATSAAILTRFLRHCGLNPPLYIPDRLNEGYGPSKAAFESLKEQGATFVIIADCGITAHEPIAQGRALGLDIAVLDHHEPEETLPNANHIVNPKRADDNSNLDMLAACGVSFMVCVATNSKLRDRGFFNEHHIKEAPLKSWMDLLGLGTVCDMVPLQGVNRLFVKAGFDQMAGHANEGIKALCAVGNITQAPTPTDAGWSIGPRINAGSRVHRSDLGAKLLATQDPQEALSIAMALEECNEERKAIQTKMMKTACDKVEMTNLYMKSIIIVDDESFHPGLSGLVAGRLKERYGKPAICITYAENPDGTIEGRGSGRSVKGVSMADMFIKARDEGLLVKGGGHAMAGGFTIEPDKLDAFRDYLYSYIQNLSQDNEIIDELEIDALATVRGAKPDFVNLLTANMGPFGMGNPEPLFALSNLRIYQADVLKDKHIRLLFSDAEGGMRMKGMFFSGVGTDLGEALLTQSKVMPFHLVGQFQINNWQGRDSVEFHIKDGAYAIDNKNKIDIKGAA